MAPPCAYAHRIAQDWEKAFLVKPMKRLPEILLPNSDTRGSPPSLHYGWVIDSARLLKIAEEKKIAPRDRREVKKLCFDEEILYDRPSVKTNEFQMMRDALDAISRELNLYSDPYLVQVFCPGKGRTHMISLVENYTLREELARIDRSDITQLTKYFGFDVGPMWFLETCNWTWNCTCHGSHRLRTTLTTQ